MSKQKKSRQNKLKVNNKVEKKTFKTKIIIAVLFVAVILFLVISNVIKNKTEDPDYIFKKQGELTFLTQDKQVKSKIDVQFADNEFDRELGLMYRKKMEENQGMLFIFPQESIQTFWMRNTFISLDMIFINSDKKIVTIRRNTTRLSDNTYASTEPAQYVLEVVAGFCNKFNIQVGDKVSWNRNKSGLTIHD